MFGFRSLADQFCLFLMACGRTLLRLTFLLIVCVSAPFLLAALAICDILSRTDD